MRSICVVLATAAFLSTTANAEVAKPAALTADGIPAVPDALAARTRPYMEFRTAALRRLERRRPLDADHHPVRQHHPAAPGRHADGRPRADQLRGRAGRAAAGRPAGDVLVVQKDVGGSEFFQLYTLANGRLTLLTDGAQPQRARRLEP